MELFYKKCLFLTSSKPLDFTFSEDFRMSRDPIPLQIDVYGNSVAKKTWIWYISRTTILHFSMKYKFGGKHCSNFSRAVFMIFFFFFTFLTDHFWSFNAFLKNKYVKGNFWHSLGHKICRLFHVSAHFLFTTIETELNYYHQNESVRVASRVAEELFFYDNTHLQICSIGIRLDVSVLTEIKYLEIEPSEKETDTNEIMMIKMFYLYGFVKWTKCIWWTKIIICLFTSLRNIQTTITFKVSDSSKIWSFFFATKDIWNIS